MITVDGVLIDDGIPSAMFRCNLALCKGACCVEGELGAPVLKEETEPLREAVYQVRQYLPEKNIRYITRNGCFEIYQGDIYTRTIEGKECVFAFQDCGIILCAIEAGLLDGETAVNKPLSCRLFPIRIKKKFGLDYLVFERHAMCRQTRKEGIEKKTPLVDYVGEPLIERYGLPWYSSLKDLLANSPINYARH